MINVDGWLTLYDTVIAARKHSAGNQDQALEDYNWLYLLDVEMHACLKAVTDAVNHLESVDGQQILVMLAKNHNWMKKALDEVKDMEVSSDACNEEFRHAFLGSLQEMKDAVESIMDVIGYRTEDDLKSVSVTVNTGETFDLNREYILNHMQNLISNKDFTMPIPPYS